MTIIIMQCDCETNIVLVVDTEAKEIRGYCPGCRKLYDIGGRTLDDDEIAHMKLRAIIPSPKPGHDSMFYLRCTDILR